MREAILFKTNYGQKFKRRKVNNVERKPQET